MHSSDLFQITFSDARYCCELGAALEQLVLTIVHCSQSPVADLEALLLLLQSRSLLFSVMGYSDPPLSTVATTPVALYCLPMGGEPEGGAGVLVVNPTQAHVCLLPVLPTKCKAPIFIALQHANGFITWEPLNASLLVERECEKLTVPLPAGLVHPSGDMEGYGGAVPTFPHDWELSHQPTTWLQWVPGTDIAQVVNESPVSVLLPTADFLEFLSPVLLVSGSRSYQPSRPALHSPVIFEFRLPPSRLNANTCVSWAHSVVAEKQPLNTETLRSGFIEALHCLHGQCARLHTLRQVIAGLHWSQTIVIRWRGLPGCSYRLIADSVEVEHADSNPTEVAVRFGADTVVLKAKTREELLGATKRTQTVASIRGLAEALQALLLQQKINLLSC